MHSEGILAGELKHGPLALIDERYAAPFTRCMCLARQYTDTTTLQHARHPHHDSGLDLLQDSLRSRAGHRSQGCVSMVSAACSFLSAF